MANPLVGMMGKSPAANPAIKNMANIKKAAESVKRMMGMLQAVKDPQQALMAAAQQNPQLNAVMQMCNGRNPQEVFYEECKKKGIDPEQVMSLLRS